MLNHYVYTQWQWNPQFFSVSVSLYTLQLREHLAKGQRTLAGEGMSQIVRSLLELLQRRSYYSGDLLFSTEILRNVTDTFKRATYIPAPDDVQVGGATESSLGALSSHKPYKWCSHKHSLTYRYTSKFIQCRVCIKVKHSCTVANASKGIFFYQCFSLQNASVSVTQLTDIILSFTIGLCTEDYCTRLDRI